MKNIYFDNAASTRIDDEVLIEIIDAQKNLWGNPTSIHALGRSARVAIEKSRQTIAKIIGAKPSEIFFTSGATEALNMILIGLCSSKKIDGIITSHLEHHAVLHTINRFSDITINFVKNDISGKLDLIHFEELLKNNPNQLVAIMHANNEIGNINPIEEIGIICKKYQALFLSDIVQTTGKISINVSEMNLDFAAATAHKFHGSKGVGFAYINSKNKIAPLLTGGGQEINMRAGTENIYGIIGLAKAMEIAYRDLEKNYNYILSLKNYFIDRLKESFSNVNFNGECENNGLNNIINISFPDYKNMDTLHIQLDMLGIYISQGSACTSGIGKGSHVIEALNTDIKQALRFSLSKYNTIDEIDFCIEKLKQILKN